MTKEQKIQALTDRIAEIIPEAKTKEWIFDESDFVVYESKIAPKISHIEWWLEKIVENKMRIDEVSFDCTKGSIKVKEYKPITLADVLRALFNVTWKNYACYGNGKLGTAGEIIDGCGSSWDLEQNALHLQDEKTISFLHNLICK